MPGRENEPHLEQSVSPEVPEMDITDEQRRLLELIPPEELIRYVAVKFSYAGPLPWPGVMKGYEEVLPGASDRIIEQFEAEGRHRREMELAELREEIRRTKFNQMAALLIVMVAVGGGLVLVGLGKSLAGFGAFFTGIVSIAGLFLYGEWKQTTARDDSPDETAANSDTK